MKVTWIGHSCFKLEEDGYSIVLDPYADGTVPGLADVRETANAVYCSHEHFDHNARDCVKIAPSGGTPFRISTLKTFHDDVQGAKRGDNLIHIIETPVTKAVHLGDLGCDPEVWQKEQIAGCDLLLIPIGGYYTIDADQAAALVRELRPKVAVPMHYRSDEAGFGFDVIGTVDQFTAHFTGVRTVAGSALELNSPDAAQIVVLRAQNQKPDFMK